MRSTLLMTFTAFAASAWAQTSDADPSLVRPAALENKRAPDPLVADAVLDDEVPLPGVALEDGTKGSGDPYFLGFVGGIYFPPHAERVDPKLASEVQLAPTDGRPAPTSYAFVMFQKRITERRLEELRALGCRVLGVHPYYTVKVALPPQQIDTVAALPFVRWIGSARTSQKLHPDAAQRIADLPAGRSIELYVNVFESDLNADTTRTALAQPEIVGPANPEPSQAGEGGGERVMSNGWQQRALESLGCDVIEYVETQTLRAFRVSVPAAGVEALLARDFVQFVDAVAPARTMHEESTPMIMNDSARWYLSGGTNGAVTSGFMDTGVSYSHYDITTHLNMVGWDYSGAGTGPWADPCGHGTHVLGTVTGNGWNDGSKCGNAPGLGANGNLRYYNVRILAGCGTQSINLASAVATMRSAYTDGGGATTQRPMIVNNSWGSSPVSGAWLGTETEARMIDEEVYWQQQMYVFAAGNDGSGGGTIGLQAGAKNAFAVGAVEDFKWGSTYPGNLASFSSRGPMADSRWKPNISAPGDWISSLSAGTTSSYTNKAGTSMASPHVAGVAAQLLDGYSWLRYWPAGAASVLMATAVPKDNAVLTSETDTHLDNYGTGRVEAFLATQGSAQTGWYNWTFNLGAGQGTEAEFSVGAGATRLVVCMNWNEQAASAGASQACINDWDLYIDQAPYAPGYNSGEWTAGVSSYDNTEIRYVEFPSAGNYKWKIHPYNATTNGRFGVTIFTVYGSTTPNMSVTTSPSDSYVQMGQPVTMTTTAYSPSYVASAVHAEMDLGGGGLNWAYRYLGDGAYDDITNNAFGSYSIEMGDILNLNSRSMYHGVSWYSEGWKTVTAQLYADNVGFRTAYGYVLVDSTAPSAVPYVQSSTHLVNTWSCDNYISTDWGGASDALSGVDGYSIVWDNSPATDPDGVVDTYALSSFDYLPDGGPWYLHVRAVDYCGNVGATTHAGPYYVNSTAVATYCTAKLNSAFCLPAISYSSRASINGPDDFHITASSILANKQGLLFWGTSYVTAPFQGGTKCVANPVIRSPVMNSLGTTGCTGTYDFHWTQAYSASYGLTEGTWLYAQYWYRDPQDPYTTGLTDALQFLICRN